MSGMQIPRKTTLVRQSRAAPVTLESRVNGALAEANARAQAIVPSLGGNPVQRLMDMVADPKFVEIIRLANRRSGRSVRKVGGAAILMDPTPSSDALLPAAVQPTVLKLRILTAWLVLARFAPVTLLRATGEWLMSKGLWDMNHFNNALSTMWTRAGAAATQAAAAVYAQAIQAWHNAQPRDFKGSPITSGPAYEVWLRLKPPAPPGVATLNGLAGLSGRALRDAYWQMQGLGRTEPDAGGDGGGVPPDTDTNQDEVPPPPDASFNPDAGGAASDAGTKEPTTVGSGEAGAKLPPELWALLANILGMAASTAVTTAGDIIQTGIETVTGGDNTPPPMSYHYAKDGTCIDGGPNLPPPPEGMEYDENGDLVPIPSSGGAGFVGGALALGGAYLLYSKFLKKR